ncbi:MAG TPA: lysylphosphatidylglycerol synthase transmembrane domain-containing protein [Terriglobia bacterium]|nr:lysylphosphatidylglycerol synthase transmembrane domain-containing protein [Terriglobia bacterium]
MTKGTRRWLGLGVTAALLALVVYNLRRSPEWRDFDWHMLWESLLHARRGYLAAAVAATLASYLLRAYRWRYFMDPFKKASVRVLFAAQIFGFGSIYLIGRLGEFVRPAYIARKEDVPVTSMLSVLALERVYDTVFMVLMLALALAYAPIHLTGHHSRLIVHHLHQGSQYIMLAMGLAVILMIVIRMRADQLVGLFSHRLGFLPERVRRTLKSGFYSFAEGLDVIRNWKDLGASLLTSAAVWLVNVSMAWFVFRALGGPLGQLPWTAGALVLFCAALGLFVQIPGLGGGYQALAIGALHYTLGVPREIATGAAFLMWIVTMVPCLAVGVVLLIVEGLSFKKLTTIAIEEKQHAGRHGQTGGPPSGSGAPPGGPGGRAADNGQRSAMQKKV